MKRIEEQLRLMQRRSNIDLDLRDMPTDEEIERLAEEEEAQRRQELEAQKNR